MLYRPANAADDAVQLSFRPLCFGSSAIFASSFPFPTRCPRARAASWHRLRDHCPFAYQVEWHCFRSRVIESINTTLTILKLDISGPYCKPSSRLSLFPPRMRSQLETSPPSVIFPSYLHWLDREAMYLNVISCLCLRHVFAASSLIYSTSMHKNLESE